MKSYEETFSLRVRDCDMSGHWRLSSILEYMQETAGTHSALLGCGRDELLPHHIVWVLSRCEIHMDRYPALGETVTVKTFPMPTRIYFFPRYYLFTDAHGNLIGRAGTLWLLLDTDTRRMLPPGDVGKLIPDNRDLIVPMHLPATVGALQGEEFVSELLPAYTDLDVNGHVNNTKYADWLCNALGLEILRDFEPESVLVNYNAEILPDQKVALRRIVHENEFRIFGSVEEKPAFDIGGVLRPRNR